MFMSISSGSSVFNKVTEYMDSSSANISIVCLASTSGSEEPIARVALKYEKSPSGEKIIDELS